MTTAALYAAGVLLLTLLTVRGMIGEEQVPLAMTLPALCAALGGGLAAGSQRGSLINTGLFGGVLVLLGLGVWDAVTPKGLLVLAAALLGGVLAAALRGRKGRRGGSRLVKSNKKPRRR